MERRLLNRRVCARRGGTKQFEVLEPRLFLHAQLFEDTRTIAAGIEPTAVVVEDFNGDGKSDLAVANFGGGTVGILLGQGDGSFQAESDYAVGIAPQCIALGDFDGDGKWDLAVVNSQDNTLSILLGNGDGSFHAQTQYSVGIYPLSVAAGDFNGDGRSDLAVTNTDSYTVSILLANGDGGLELETDYAVDHYPESATVGDFNGDGKCDLAVANEGNNTVSIFLGNGDGTFQPLSRYTAGWYPSCMAVGDFDRDGKSDLVVGSWTDHTVSVLLGSDDGGLRFQNDYAVGINPWSVAVGDFDGNGTSDLAVTTCNNVVAILPGNGDGSFQARTEYAVGIVPCSVSVGDFNGDAKSDLVVANQGSNTLSILLNTTPSPTWTTIGVVESSCTYGQTLTLDATVSGSSGIPTGTVTFFDGSTVLGTCTLDGEGATTLSVSSIHAGSHRLTADYSGDSHNASSDSMAAPLTVAKADQTITWTSPAPIVPGTPLGYAQLDATVAGLPGGSTPGSLTYSPAADTVLGSGVYTLSVTAAATSDYNAASADVSLTVLRPCARSATLSSGSFAYGLAAAVAFSNVQGSAEGLVYSLDLNGDGISEVSGGSPTCEIPASYLVAPGMHAITGRIVGPDGGYTDYPTSVWVEMPTSYNPTVPGVTWVYTGVATGRKLTDSTACFADQLDGASMLRRHTDRTYGDGVAASIDNLAVSGGFQTLVSESPSGYTSTETFSSARTGLPLRNQPGLSVSWGDLSFTVKWSYTNGDVGGSSAGTASGGSAIKGIRSLTLSNGLRFPQALAARTHERTIEHVDWDNGNSAVVTSDRVTTNYYVRAVGMVKTVERVTRHYVYENGRKRTTVSTFNRELHALPDAAIFATVEGTTLHVRGTTQADTITFARSGSDLLCYRNGVSQSVPLDWVHAVVIDGMGGDDLIDARTLTVPVTIDGGAGSDSIRGGRSNDSIVGGDGDDTIYGGAGNDTLVGGLGHDLLVGGAGANRFESVDGVVDVLDGRGGRANVGIWDVDAFTDTVLGKIALT